jgi:hypothetical protein
LNSQCELQILWGKMGVVRVSRLPTSSLLHGVGALFAVVLLLCSAFFLQPVASRPLVNREGRQLLSEADAEAGVEERFTLESSEVATCNLYNA